MKVKTLTDCEIYLKEIRDAVVGIHNFLTKSKDDTNVYAKTITTEARQHIDAQDIVLSREVVLTLLQVSESTLAKWRCQKVLKFERRGKKLLEYRYISLMDALKANKLIARGFDSIAAYQRMLDWYEKNVGQPETKDNL